MPHESTVAHEQRFVADSPIFSRSRQTSVLTEGQQQESNGNVVPVKTKVTCSMKIQVFIDVEKYGG